MTNAITVILPYKCGGMWVFDDPNVGLRREPFVSGIDKIINTMTQALGITDPEKGFRLLFSGSPFPGFNTILTHIEKDRTTHIPGLMKGDKDEFIPRVERGDWYFHPETGMEGWLCPALLKYFDEAPARLYIKLESDPDADHDISTGFASFGPGGSGYGVLPERWMTSRGGYN